MRLTHAAIFSGTGRQRRQARVQAFKVVLSTSIENETEKVREEAVSTSQEEIPAGEQKIYVGNGRFVVDDPRKYPDRNALTGGFAGGEVRYTIQFPSRNLYVDDGLECKKLRVLRLH